MLSELGIAGLNHLLAGEEWASKHLRSFAGQTLRVELGQVAVFLTITNAGNFGVPNESDCSPTVTLSLPADAPLKLWLGQGNRSSMLASARISGSAELAECLGFVFRNLHWDVESDLATWVGDIAAHRLVAAGKQFGHWQKQKADNLARNLVEYLSDETPLISKPRDISAFCRETNRLLSNVDSLEKRVAALEGRTK